MLSYKIMDLLIKKKLKTNQTLMIRSPKIKDAESLIQFVKEVSSETEYLTRGFKDHYLSLEEEQQFILEKKMKKNHYLLIGEIDGSIIGSLGFAGGSTIRTQHKGEFGITVKQKYWNPGVGKYLMTELISWANSMNCIKKINLTVRIDNKYAIKLYEQFGFRIEGTIEREFLIDGIFYDANMMGLNIN